MPSASAIAIMVAAVPIIMQVPNERAMPPSISSQSSSLMLPARFSSQYFQASEPEPSCLAAPIAAQHRPGRHIDRRHTHADRAHEQAGRGLVAAAHQHRTVDRMRAQQFLGLHREEVAVEHGRGLHERFGQRHRRQFDREAARLQDAALHVLGTLAQMAVAGVDVAPGIDDADHRLAGPVLAVIAELAQPRAVAERAQVVTPSQRWLRRSSAFVSSCWSLSVRTFAYRDFMLRARATDTAPRPRWPQARHRARSV